MFSPTETADDADGSASELLDLLGWRHARTGPKGRPFEQSCQVLGCTINLCSVKAGRIVLENKPARIDRMLKMLAEVKLAGKISLHETQVLHGLLRYACAFSAGRHLHQACAEVMQLGTGMGRTKTEVVASFCDYASAVLGECSPKVIDVCEEQRPILVFTDGSWEGGAAGVGAVVVDAAKGNSMVLSGTVPQELLNFWSKSVGEQLICQIEFYTMVVVRWQLKETLTNRRSIWWVDNESSRFAVIKGLSSSLTMKALAREFDSVDYQAQAC